MDLALPLEIFLEEIGKSHRILFCMHPILRLSLDNCRAIVQPFQYMTSVNSLMKTRPIVLQFSWGHIWRVWTVVGVEG